MTKILVLANETIGGRNLIEKILERPVIAPMKDFRDTPMASGRPRPPSAESPPSTAESHASHESASSLKNPMPGSRQIRSS